MIARNVVRLECARRPYKVVLDNGVELAARSVVIATGAQYNKPRIANRRPFRRTGRLLRRHLHGELSSAATTTLSSSAEAIPPARPPFTCRRLSARKSTYSCVPASASDTMSRYLIQRIEQNPNIEIHYRTEITSLEGDSRLTEHVCGAIIQTGEIATVPIRHVFIMAGASPRTEWLKGVVSRSTLKDSFSRDAISTVLLTNPPWPLARSAQMLETSLPGVFAVGDVRSGNVKRVASAVGEGAIAIHLVHRALAEL